MKTQKTKGLNKKSVRNDYTIEPALQGKYDGQPFFQEKIERANFIIKKFGAPKFDDAK